MNRLGLLAKPLQKKRRNELEQRARAIPSHTPQTSEVQEDAEEEEEKGRGAVEAAAAAFISVLFDEEDEEEGEEEDEDAVEAAAAFASVLFQIKEAGRSAQDLKSLSALLVPPQAALYDLADFRAAGCDWAAIRLAGFPAADCKAAGCDAAAAHAAGYDVPSILSLFDYDTVAAAGDVSCFSPSGDRILWTIFIEVLGKRIEGGNTLTLKVQLSDSVASIQAKIRDICGLDGWKLFFCGRCLNEYYSLSLTLADFSVQNDSTLHLCPLIPEKIQITWKGFFDDGKKLVSAIGRRSLFNSSNPTVEDLKREATENPFYCRMSYKSEERWSVL